MLTNAHELIPAEYKLREYVSCRLRARGVGGIAGRVMVGDGTENETKAKRTSEILYKTKSSSFFQVILMIVKKAHRMILRQPPSGYVLLFRSASI